MSSRAIVQQQHFSDITDVAGHDQKGISGPPNTGACSPLAANPMSGPRFMDQLITKIIEAMARLEKEAMIENGEGLGALHLGGKAKGK